MRERAWRWRADGLTGPARYLIDREISASPCSAWRSPEQVTFRPLVAPSRVSRLSRNVRISGTLTPYHHKAAQHEWARHASRILSSSASASVAGGDAAGTRGEAERRALLTAAAAPRRALATTRPPTRVRYTPLPLPLISHLLQPHKGPSELRQER